MRGDSISGMTVAMEDMQIYLRTPKPEPLITLLRRFLAVQESRAQIYSRLKRGFSEYLRNGAEGAYQRLCSQVTTEFNDCSKQVIEMESLLGNSDYHRGDLVELLKTVQVNEKQKLHMTATIQVLKKAGRPSDRLTENGRFHKRPAEAECTHAHDTSQKNLLELSCADAEYDAALNEAIRAVQEAVTHINEQMEIVRYEIDDLEANSDCNEDK